MLTEEQISKIKELHAIGTPITRIAKEVSTYTNNIYYILYPEKKALYMKSRQNWQDKNRSKTRKYALKTRNNYKSNAIFTEKLIGAFKRRKSVILDIKLLTEQFFIKFGRKEFYECYITGDIIPAYKISLDHIIPLSQGGEDNINNIGITNWKINRMKGDNTLEEFIELCNKVSERHKNTK
jgi:5-methylcytosine-specific restriction endonuclease McrA